MASSGDPERLGPGAPGGGSLAIVDAKVYPEPGTPPIPKATVLVVAGRIVAVGPEVAVPSGVSVLEGHGGIVSAGFWNTHVHLTESKWSSPDRRSPETLNGQLADLFSRRGFTTAVDLGSNPRSTRSIRSRIARGELRGPRLYTSGTPIYPPHGIPYYLDGSLPFYFRWFMPQPSRPPAARRAVRRGLARGADVVKLFTGSYVRRGEVRPMPEPIATAAVEAAHARGRLVFAHPSNLAGTRVASRAGVDVLAHAPDTTEGIDDGLLADLERRGTAMVPTLKMFATTVTSDAGYLGPILDVVRRFRGLGGELLFGTDVGYMADYSTDEEFELLARAGLDATYIHRMLTTAPARRFGVSDSVGSVAPGKVGDLVVLDEDPADRVTAFARVRCTVREGKVLWDGRTSR